MATAAAVAGGRAASARPTGRPAARRRRSKHEPVSILITDLTNDDRRPDVRRHPRADAEAGARRRGVHQRLRPQRHPAQPRRRRRPSGSTRKPAARSPSSRASASCSPARSRATAAATRVTLKATESVTGNVIADDVRTVRPARTACSAVATDARQPRPHGPRRRHLRLGAALRDRDAVGDLARRRARVRHGDAGAVQQPVRRGARSASAAPSSSTRTSAWPTPAWPSRRPTWASRRKPSDYVKEAIRHVDRMTERERFRTRGMFYYITNDYEACVKEYGDLLAQYEADVAARNNLALCSTKLRDMTRAREEMQRVVEILPKRSLYRVNASLYSTYAGDFAAGRGARRGSPRSCSDPWALQALALAKQGQGDFADATASLRGAGQRAGRRAVLHRRRAWPTSRSTRAASATPRRSSPRAPRPTSAERTATAPRPSSPRWPTPSCPAAGRAQARGRRRQGRWPTAPACRSASWPAASTRRPGRRPRRAASPPSWSTNCRPSRRPTARSSKASSRSSRSDARLASAAVRGQQAARHLDRPLRPRPRLPGRRRVPAGRLRVRPLPEAQRRGAVALPRRGADVRLPAAGVLLPGTRPRRHGDRRPTPTPTAATWRSATRPTPTRSPPTSASASAAAAASRLVRRRPSRSDGPDPVRPGTRPASGCDVRGAVGLFAAIGTSSASAVAV